MFNKKEIKSKELYKEVKSERRYYRISMLISIWIASGLLYHMDIKGDLVDDKSNKEDKMLNINKKDFKTINLNEKYHIKNNDDITDELKDVMKQSTQQPIRVSIPKGSYSLNDGITIKGSKGFFIDGNNSKLNIKPNYVFDIDFLSKNKGLIVEGIKFNKLPDSKEKYGFDFIRSKKASTTIIRNSEITFNEYKK